MSLWQMFCLRLENRDDNVSVDRLRSFYEDKTGRRNQPGQEAASVGYMTAAKIQDDEFGNRPKRTVRPPNRLGFERLVRIFSAL